MCWDTGVIFKVPRGSTWLCGLLSRASDCSSLFWGPLISHMCMEQVRGPAACEGFSPGKDRGCSSPGKSKQ